MRGLVRAIAHHPARLLEWVQWLVLAIMLCIVGWNLGGYVPGGYGLAAAAPWVAALGVTHALYWLLRRDRPKVQPLWWLPFPFLVWITGSTVWQSPAGWDAAAHLWVWWVAALVYWVVLHLPRSQRTLHGRFALIGCVAFLAIIGAACQYYLFPYWFSQQERLVAVHGVAQATGFFRDGQTLAAVTLVFWPFAVVGMLMRRLPGPVRIFLGFMVLASLNMYLISMSRAVVPALVLTVMGTPLLVAARGRKRRRWWLWLPLGLLVVGGLSWVVSDTWRQHLESVPQLWVEGRWMAGWAEAWTLFRSQPLAGNGWASFAYVFESLRDAASQALAYPANFGLLLLAETGAVGAVLLVACYLLLVGRLWRRWAAIPWVKVTADELFREAPHALIEAQQSQALAATSTSGQRVLAAGAQTAAGEPDHSEARRASHKRRRKHKQREGSAPLMKVYGAAALLGLVQLPAILLLDSSLMMPVVLWLSAVFGAIAAWMADAGEDKLAGYGVSVPLAPGARIGLSLVAVVMGFAVLRFAPPVWDAQHHVTTARSLLDSALADPAAIFADATPVQQARAEFLLATRLLPGHGPAWLGAAEATLALHHAETATRQQLAAEAMTFLDRALAVMNADWRVYAALARALDWQRADAAAVRAQLEIALEVAPNQPSPWVHLAELAWRKGDTAATRAALDAALALDPGFQPAVALRARWGL
jgi:tetratricopeptide (TPR) repeat protein